MKENKVGTPQPAEASVSDLLTDNELAPMLSVEPRTLRLWRNTRGLPFIRITSKVIRYRRTDVNAWMDRQRTVIAA
jgi:DNA-binding transcriptional MerR regulator